MKDRPLRANESQAIASLIPQIPINLADGVLRAIRAACEVAYNNAIEDEGARRSMTAWLIGSDDKEN